MQTRLKFRGNGANNPKKISILFSTQSIVQIVLHDQVSVEENVTMFYFLIFREIAHASVPYLAIWVSLH